jgi:hypothetical protein
MSIEDAADRASLLVDEGEPFVHFDGDQTREITALFMNAYQKVESTRGPVVAGSRPQIVIALDVVTEPEQGDLLYRGALSTFAGDFDYEVASVRPDSSEDMATLILKKAAQ